MKQKKMKNNKEYREFLKRNIDNIKLKPDNFDIDAIVEEMQKEGFDPKISSINPGDYKDFIGE